MSDNNLLKENTIRRFMKLANVNSLTDNFISEKYTRSEEDKKDKKEKKDDDLQKGGGRSGGGNQKGGPGGNAEDVVVQKEQMEDPEMEDPEMDEPEMDEPEMDEPEMDEPEMDEPEMDDELGAADISLTEEEAQLLIDLGERLKEAMEDDEDDMDMEDDEDLDDMDMDMEDDMAPDAPEEEEPAGMRSEPGMSYMQEQQDEIVQEVLRRVTKRILANRG